MGLFSLFSTRTSIQDSGILKDSVVRHSHVLFGVDDGIRTLEDSLSVLSYMETLGIRELWCTPHVMEDVPNATEALKTRFKELESNYAGPIRLRLAAEYMLDTVFEARLESRDFLTMEDGTVLVETSTIAPPYDLKGMLSELMSAGYRPMMAHPERARFLGVEDCKELVSKGVALQLNIASLTGYYGNTARQKAESLLKLGLYSAYGSDCHREKVLKDQYSRNELTKDIIKKLVALTSSMEHIED